MLGHERSQTPHLARFSNYILDTEVGRPADTPCETPKLSNSINCYYKSTPEENECYWYWWWRRWWCWWWRWRWAWKSRYSTVRFVKMVFKSWTWLFQNLGFERFQISCCCRTQRKVTRPRLRSEREENHHLAWSSSASLKMETAALQRISKMKKFKRQLLQIDIEEVPDIQWSLDADYVWR